MAIEPIKGFYVHDEETDTDGVAKVSIEAVQEFEDDIRDETSKWLDDHPEATTTVQDGAIIESKINSDFLPSIKNLYVTPQMFGAVADGVTDDTTAVRTAINSGYIVFFPNGEYLLSGRISLRSNLKLEGGTNAVLKWATFSGGTSLIGGQGFTQLSIKNLAFDFGTQSELRYGLSLLETTYSEVVNCSFKNGYGYATRINGSSFFDFINCEFSDITGATGNPGGAIFGSDFHDVNIRGCVCSNIGDHFAYLAGTVEIYNVTISDCTAISTGANNLTNGCAITLYANAHNVTITNCNFKNCKGGVYAGYYGDYTTVPHDFTISNSTFIGTTASALELIGLSAARMYNVNISNLSINNSNSDSFILRHALRFNVNNITIDNSYRYSMEVSDAIYCTFSNVNIAGVRDTGLIVGLNGDSIYNTFSNFIITPRSTSSQTSGATGLYMRAGTNNTFINFTINSFKYKNYVKGGANNVYINAQDSQKSLMFTTDITEVVYHNVGDVVFNATPASGSPAAWICTAAGTPGTMTPIATL